MLTVLYVVSVRQTRGLPAPSFRFHLPMDTLGVQRSPSHHRVRDFHTLDSAHEGRTMKSLPRVRQAFGLLGVQHPDDAFYVLGFGRVGEAVDRIFDLKIGAADGGGVLTFEGIGDSEVRNAQVGIGTGVD